MSHPFASQSASSTARRLKAIGGKGASAGKAWGSTAMSSKGGGRSYPSKNAGSQVPYFAEGGSVGTRPDRMARGGKGKKKGHTTNVVVNIPPSGGPPIGAAPGLPPGPPPAPPIPIQVPRAAPPVAPGPMPVAGPGPMPVRPPVVLPPGARPPGMKRGGSVKHMADGGFMDTSNQPLGQGGPQRLPGWNSGLKKGGSVKRAQLGMAVPPAAAARAPVVPVPAPVAARTAALAKRGAVANRAAVNRQALRDAAATANPRAAAAAGPRPYKRGGETAAQEAKDTVKHERAESKVKEKSEHMANGGGVKQGGGGTAQYGEDGSYPVMKNAAGGGLGRMEKIKKAPV